ncbi:MAG: 2-oxo-4-hydroxy-4-carboxy-5-ureidoimidazoline decarboxylase [Gemmatimonadetes bacterium]|nr:2-oxo-4-hydroxy-4-carboxy-5-ureidoimidazoline decarboxylase [Gemmatimonadota bacterium]
MTLQDLNALDRAAFVAAVGSVFEHSPWIAERAWELRPFADLAALHAALVATMHAAEPEEQLCLIRAHPDLVGRAARLGTLTAASTSEQAGAGLDSLSAEEIALFDRYNAEYRAKFGFPFVICARENKKESILAAFPVRLGHSAEEETETALAEIAKIASFRLRDIVSTTPVGSVER